MLSFVASVVPYVTTIILYLFFTAAARFACILVLYAFVRPKHVDPVYQDPNGYASSESSLEPNRKSFKTFPGPNGHRYP